MIKFPLLLPECYVDTAFVEMLGFKEPNHQAGISRVSTVLERKLASTKAMGFIDNDKRKTDYIRQFELIDQVNQLRLFKHPKRTHFLVAVDPAMDRFIFNLAQNLEIKLSKYRFPSDFPGFLERTKKVTIISDPYFKNFLNAIAQKRPPEIVQVRSWIRKYS
jgi:hypothetical protein